MPRFEFESDLESSRVYRKALRDTIDGSFRGSMLSTAWSIFSDLSMSDISTVSVIALPISAADLTNGQHYNFAAAQANQDSEAAITNMARQESHDETLVWKGLASQTVFNPRTITARGILQLYDTYLSMTDFHSIYGNLRRSPSTGKEKLAKLTSFQIRELVVDVLDELHRRVMVQRSCKGVPFRALAIDFYHPKRNDARRRMGDAPVELFFRLTRDLYLELQRRSADVDTLEPTTGAGKPTSLMS